jgi:hypothetical protein
MDTTSSFLGVKELNHKADHAPLLHHMHYEFGDNSNLLFYRLFTDTKSGGQK